MSIVKITDKRIGVTYVYEQDKGVWDPQKKQTRTKRKLIGKIDPETGEIVPTKGWGKHRASVKEKNGEKDYKKLYEEAEKQIDDLNQKLAAKDIEIAKLKEELHKSQNL